MSAKADQIVEQVKSKLETGAAYQVRGHWDGDFTGTCVEVRKTYAVFKLRNGKTREILFGKWLEVRPA